MNHLESAFLIRTVNRIDRKAKKFERANYFKIYLTNSSIRSASFTPIDEFDDFFGNIVETAVFSQFQHSTTLAINYARWKRGEVDIVYLDSKQKPYRAVEVKWSNRFINNTHELANIRRFCSTHNLTECWVTTKDIFKVEFKEDFTYRFIPSALFCLFVSQDIMEGKFEQLKIVNEKA